MENNIKSLTEQQACESALKIQDEEQSMRARRFCKLSKGCIIYALFYTFCLYHNKSGITAPFFVGVTLYFFMYYFKKFGVTASKNKRFLMAALGLLGIVSCTTDSQVLIGLNGIIGTALMIVMILQTFHDDSNWKIATYFNAAMHLIFGSLTQIGKPFSDGAAYIKKYSIEKSDEQKRMKCRQMVGAVILGIAISIPMVFLIGPLLMSADALFSEMLLNAFDSIFTLKIFGFLKDIKLFDIIFMIAAIFVYVYGIFAYSVKKEHIEKVTQKKNTEWDSYIAVTFTSIIGVMYCIFSGVQIFGLFLGKMKLPENYTYSFYARQGFFQLLFVCIFNICLVLICLAFFKSSRILRVILTIISMCTYIMTASSAYRMLMYISMYHLTFLRVFVLWVLVIIAVIMVGVVYYIYHPDFKLFWHILVTVTVGYLCFAAIHPDYWIARYNISQISQTENVDTWYLQSKLSADAAPAFKNFDVSEVTMYDLWDKDFQMNYYNRILEYTEDMHIRNWNMSRYVARYYAKQYIK